MNIKYLAIIMGSTFLLCGHVAAQSQTYLPATPLCTPASDVVVEVDFSHLQALQGPQSSSPTEDFVMQYRSSPRPDKEAEIYAALLYNTVLATTKDYNRVKNDMANIRQQFPQVQNVRELLPDDGTVLALTYPDGNPLISTANYDEMNRYFGLCYEEIFADFGTFVYRRLQFPARLNIPALANYYSIFTMPNLYSSGEEENPFYAWTYDGGEDYIRLSNNQSRAREKQNVMKRNGLISSVVNTDQAADDIINYKFEDGWMDCIDGLCECIHTYTFETDEDSNVTFLDFTEYYNPFIGEDACMAFIDPN